MIQIMKTQASTVALGAEQWARAIEFEGGLSQTAARSLLKLRFSSRDHERMQELSDKARSGQLSARDKVEIDNYERLGCLLDILHSKARQSMRKAKPTG